MNHRSQPGGPGIQPAPHGFAPQEPKSVVLRTQGALLLHEEPGALTVGALDNVLIAVWRSAASARCLAELETAIKWMQILDPLGRSAVHIVHNGRLMPSPETQQGFIELIKRSQPACCAAVLLGSGFWASALRSATTQVAVHGHRGFEFRQHQDLREVVTWLPEKHHELTGVRVRPERLTTVLEAFTAY